MPTKTKLLRAFSFYFLTIIGLVYLFFLILITPKVFSGFFMQLIYLVQFCRSSLANLFPIIQTTQFWFNISGGIILFYLYFLLFRGLIVSFLNYQKTKLHLSRLKILKIHPQYTSFYSSSPQAFTAGFLHPRVYLSSSLVQICSPSEFRAILFHEQQHQQNFDPLKDSIINFIFFITPPLPLKKYLFNLNSTLTEINCDYYALNRLSHPRPLFSALQKILQHQFLNTSAFGQASSQRLLILTGHQKFSPSKLVMASLFPLSFYFLVFAFIFRTDLLFECQHLAQCLSSLFQPQTSFQTSHPQTPGHTQFTSKYILITEKNCK